MALKNSLPERYKSIISFYVKGKSNALEMLKEDLAHWPPKGMNITNPPDIEVDFKSALRDPDTLKRAIPGFWNLGLTYGISKNYPILGAAFFALTAFKRVLNMAGFVRPNSEPNTIYINGLWRAFNMFQRGRRFLSHTIMHELKHVLQARDNIESLSSSLSKKRKNPLQYVKEEHQGTKSVKYLAEECEIQARLHTIMVGSFHQHGAFPLNRSELLEALTVQGVKVPKEMLWENRKTPEGDAAFQFYRKDLALHDRYADKSAVSEVNYLIRKLDPKHHDAFFKQLLPFIWGDIIELWGDQQGHKRFGHTHNIQLRELFYKAAGDYATLKVQKDRNVLRATRQRSLASNDNEGQSLDIDKRIASSKSDFLRAIKAMDVEDAVDLGSMLLTGFVYKELGTASKFVPKKRGSHYDAITSAAIRAISERDDLTAQDHRTLRVAASLYKESHRGLTRRSLRDASGDFHEAISVRTKRASLFSDRRDDRRYSKPTREFLMA